ncbi:MAG TPA: hypothetical protein VIG24_09575, partial [Acidimicrobiia bacterium]
MDEFDLSSEVDELRQALTRQQRATRRAQLKTDDLVEAVYRAARDAAMAVRPNPLPAKAARDS